MDRYNQVGEHPQHKKLERLEKIGSLPTYAGLLSGILGIIMQLNNNRPISNIGFDIALLGCTVASAGLIMTFIAADKKFKFEEEFREAKNRRPPTLGI